jgi:hypothetical protein
MPRFFFHVVNDIATVMDEDGTDIENVHAACHHARAIIGDIIGDEIAGGPNVIHLTIMIDDAEGCRVANIKAVTRIVISASPFAE